MSWDHIEATGLVKRFGKRTVLAGLDLHVGPGTVYAVLGRNGAGKTTLLRCLAGLYVPVEGSIRWRHADGVKDRFADDLWWRQRTYWVDAEENLPPFHTGRGWLSVVAELYRLEAGATERLDDLVDLLSLREALDERILGWSRGQKKKLGLAAAFLVAPDLLLLDEPFAGEIDPPGIEAVTEMLEALAATGSAVVMASQLSEMVAPLAHRVGLLARGRIVEEGAPAELVERLGVRSLATAVASTGDPTEVDPQRLAEGLRTSRSS